MFTNLTECFTAICNALRSKKNTSDKIAVDDIPNEILNLSIGIDTSDATATASDIATGKTAYAKGSKLTGTLKTVKTYKSHLWTNYSWQEITVGFTPTVVIIMAVDETISNGLSYLRYDSESSGGYKFYYGVNSSGKTTHTQSNSCSYYTYTSSTKKIKFTNLETANLYTILVVGS